MLECWSRAHNHKEKEMDSGDRVVQVYAKSVRAISEFLQEATPHLPEGVIAHNAKALIARLAENNLLIEDVVGDV